MIHTKEIVVPADTAERIKAYLDLRTPDVWLGEDETISINCRFSNGVEMDVKCCGAGPDEPAWTEAVLYDRDGCQIGVSDPDVEFAQRWELEDDLGDTYIVEVEFEKKKEE